MVTHETLARMELFEGLPDEVLTCIAELSREESYPRGTTIFAAGRLADRMYLLLEGTVSLWVQPTSLPEPMTVVVLRSPGQTFGWSAVVGSGYYTAGAQATSDARAISIDGLALVDCLEQHPCEGFVVMRRVAQVVSQRLGSVRTLLLETVCG